MNHRAPEHQRIWVLDTDQRVLLRIVMLVACEHFFALGVAQSIGVTQRI